MSRIYDISIEPAVIDEDMLRRAVEEQGPKGEAGEIAREEGVDFANADSLRLDFKNILKIDNLWMFQSIVKLQMDNNIIEKIEGLECLVNLEWLDLSFNNIEVIEGLEKLTKLKDLTLFSNRIRLIENMDSLESLHVLSLGNNQLNDLENAVYLRKFRTMRTLNLEGNPFCTRDEYRNFIIAHLPYLEFLDYRLIDEKMRGEALEAYKELVQELVEEEESIKREAEEKRVKEDEFNLHRSGYIENLNGSYMYESLFFEDAEGEKLSRQPGVPPLLVELKAKFTEICINLFNFGLAELERRNKEMEAFDACIDEAKEENKQSAMGHIARFHDYQLKVFAELTTSNDAKQVEEVIAEYNRDVSDLWDKLMALELQLVDQLDETIKEFERNMQEIVAAFIENVQGLIAQLRDLENQHHERLMEISLLTLEKVIKNEFVDELTEDVRELFVDKDAVMNAVSASHDLHLLRIDNREDDIVTKITQWMKTMMDRIHQSEEVVRNRKRVSEINNLIDHLREDVENLELLV